MAYNEDKIKDANLKLETKLIKDKDSWNNKISTIIQMVKDISELSECQAFMLSYRQTLLDKIIEIKSTIYKRNVIWDKFFKSKWRDYSINYDIKLTNPEKKQFINSDLSELKFQIKLLEMHVDFYLECIKTLDNMAFAIKNKISLNNEE